MCTVNLEGHQRASSCIDHQSKICNERSTNKGKKRCRIGTCFMITCTKLGFFFCWGKDKIGHFLHKILKIVTGYSYFYNYSVMVELGEAKPARYKVTFQELALATWPNYCHANSRPSRLDSNSSVGRNFLNRRVRRQFDVF